VNQLLPFPTRTAPPLVVVGDALLDVDLEGVVRRVCPDAPAPVLDDLEERPRPGGAALAAWLAAEGGRDVVLVTALADDEPARRLRSLLDGRVRVLTVPTAGSTPVKKRVRSRGQTLLRLDEGVRGELGDAPNEELREVLRAAGAVLVSDYGRGLASHPGVRAALAEVVDDLPVTWDPHTKGAPPVPGIALATPNQEEARLLAPRHGGDERPGQADGAEDGLPGAARHARALRRHWSASAVAVTLGARGALLATGDGAPLVVPAPNVVALDTCGAGDAFAAAVTGLLAAGVEPGPAVAAAVEVAARFVAAGGASAVAAGGASAVAGGASAVAGGGGAGGVGGADDGLGNPVGPGADLDAVVAATRARGGSVVVAGGCFDLVHAGHVRYLEAARRLGDCLVVALNSDEGVRRLKGPGRPIVGEADRERVLRALACVDAVVVFDEPTPSVVLERVRPDVFAKGGDYTDRHIEEADVMARWGGAVVTLPYLDGRSTTNLLRTLQGDLEPAADA
jgi:D-beta-D-heptose 7-phosphate kinase/D-beta-D-heptose 1-phosphate adenosyltransferase